MSPAVNIPIKISKIKKELKPKSRTGHYALQEKLLCSKMELNTGSWARDMRPMRYYGLLRPSLEKNKIADSSVGPSVAAAISRNKRLACTN